MQLCNKIATVFNPQYQIISSDEYQASVKVFFVIEVEHFDSNFRIQVRSSDSTEISLNSAFIQI